MKYNPYRDNMGFPTEAKYDIEISKHLSIDLWHDVFVHGLWWDTRMGINAIFLTDVLSDKRELMKMGM